MTKSDISQYRLCQIPDAIHVQAQDKKQGAVGKYIRKLRRPSTIFLILGWVILIGLFIYVQQYAKELSPFDPFEILQVDTPSSVLQHLQTHCKIGLQEILGLSHAGSGASTQACAFCSKQDMLRLLACSIQ